MSFNKTFVLFALAVLAMTAFAVLATMPTAGRLMARERTAHLPCHIEQIPQDKGYGVSSFVERRVCDED